MSPNWNWPQLLYSARGRAVHHGQAVLDAPGWISGHLMSVHMTQDISQILETMNNILETCT